MVKHLLSAVAVVAAALSVSSAAHAEDLALHFNGGAAIPAVGSQFNTYKVGIGADASAMWLLGRNLAIGPQIAAMTMEPREGSTYRHVPGAMWSFEGAFRIQGNHDSNAWLSPWIGGSGGVALIGRLAEPVVDVSLGLDLATSKDHTAYLGVFAKGTHAFVWLTGDNTNLISHGDPVNVLTLGLSGSWDFPGVTRVRNQVVTKPELIVERVPVFINEGARTNPPTAIAAGSPCPTATEAPLSLTEKVYFNVDQSSLDWMDRDALDVLIANLKAHPEVSVSVVGNASQDHKSLTPAQAKHDADLAQKRGQAVVSYLTSNGINASRILVSASANGSGGNETTEARERNRNATLKVEVLTK